MSSPLPAGKTEILPLFPLGTVLVPHMRLSLHVFEPRYRQLVSDLLSGDEPTTPVFGVVALRQGWEVGELSDVYDVGTTARVTDVQPLGDGRYDLYAVGEQRFTIRSVDTTARPYLLGSVRYLPEADGDVPPGAHAAVAHSLRAYQDTLIELHAVLPEESSPSAGPDAHGLSYLVAEQSWLPLADRQHLLAARDTYHRLVRANAVLRRENELLRQLRAVPVTAAMFRSTLGSD